MECKDRNRPVKSRRTIVLIETYWNVKVKRGRSDPDRRQRINRNILECKGMYSVLRSAPRSCINRNILECKERRQMLIMQHAGVLIETYWNVKMIPAYNSLRSSAGINRNILECKVTSLEPSFTLDFRINRNILECKVYGICQELPGKQRINRNILECKDRSEAGRRKHNSVLIETYWNVKFRSYARLPYRPCINRNILECKDKQTKSFEDQDVEY